MGGRERRGELVLSTRWEGLAQIPCVTLSTESRPLVIKGEEMAQVTDSTKLFSSILSTRLTFNRK